MQTERKLTKPEAKAKERIVKDLKGAKADFKKRYGKDAEAVMYATATKRAKKIAEAIDPVLMEKIAAGLLLILGPVGIKLGFDQLIKLGNKYVAPAIDKFYGKIGAGAKFLSKNLPTLKDAAKQGKEALELKLQDLLMVDKLNEGDCGCGCEGDCGQSNINSVINELIEDLVYEELCKRGKAYIAARKRAGEKSSAYLSGRAVKVCKGQIRGVGGKRKKSYRKKKRKRRTNEALYQQLRTQTLRHLEETLFNDPHFAIIAEYENINEVSRKAIPITIKGKTYSSMGDIYAKKALAKLSPEERKKAIEKAMKDHGASKQSIDPKDFEFLDGIDLGNPVDESLRNWFKKEDWVRIDTQGNIAGKCGTMPKGKATQRCLPRAKAQSLTKAQRRATARKKVRGSKKGKQFVRNTKKAKVSFKKK